MASTRAVIAPHADLVSGHKRPLTDEHKRFVEEYCVDLDGKAAMVRMGNPPDHDTSTRAARFLRTDEIREAIDVRLRELSKRTVSNATFVRERLVEVVERCMQKEPVMERRLNPDTGKVEDMPTGEWEFNAQGANKALELLGRHHGMFADKLIITIEHELKAMPAAELEQRIRRIQEQMASTDMHQDENGTYVATSSSVEEA